MIMLFKKKEKPFADALDENRRMAKSEDDWLDFMWFTREESEQEKNKLRFADWWQVYKKRSWTIR
jgi:hypothetical protein